MNQSRFSSSSTSRRIKEEIRNSCSSNRSDSQTLLFLSLSRTCCRNSDVWGGNIWWRNQEMLWREDRPIYQQLTRPAGLWGPGLCGGWRMLPRNLDTVQGWTGTKIWPWTFWSRPAHYSLRADIVPTRPVDVHTNTQALNNSTILNNVPLYSEALNKIHDS